LNTRTRTGKKKGMVLEEKKKEKTAIRNKKKDQRTGQKRCKNRQYLGGTCEEGKGPGRHWIERRGGLGKKKKGFMEEGGTRVRNSKGKGRATTTRRRGKLTKLGVKRLGNQNKQGIYEGTLITKRTRKKKKRGRMEKPSRAVGGKTDVQKTGLSSKHMERGGTKPRGRRVWKRRTRWNPTPVQK